LPFKTTLIRPVGAAITALMLAAALLPAAACAQRCAPGATLDIMQAEPPRSMDPADETATDTNNILDPLYETLVRTTADGTVVPWLALSWAHSPNGQDWDFSLRPDVRFHDGAPMDARAVVASFRRLLSPERGLAAAGAFQQIIASATATDAMTVHFHLRQPMAFFLNLMSVTQAGIVSPVADAARRLGPDADGTGPMQLSVWDHGASVTEIRNPHYWGTPARYAALRWRWSSETSVLNMALKTGDADIVLPLAPVFASLLQRDPSYHLINTPSPTLYWVALNTRLPPLDDARVRRALDTATDRDALVAGLLHGFGQAACYAVPPSEAGALQCDVSHADPDASRAALRDAGHPGGIDISVAVQEPEEPIAEALQAMWAKAGIRLHIRKLEAGLWAQAAFAGPAAKARDELHAVIASWSEPFNTDEVLRPIYQSINAAPTGANLGFFSDRETDSLIDRAAGTLDAAARASIYRTLQLRLKEQMPVLPLYTRNALIAAGPQISGVKNVAELVDVSTVCKSTAR